MDLKNLLYNFVSSYYIEIPLDYSGFLGLQEMVFELYAPEYPRVVKCFVRLWAIQLQICLETQLLNFAQECRICHESVWQQDFANKTPEKKINQIAVNDPNNHVRTYRTFDNA